MLTSCAHQHGESGRSSRVVGRLRRVVSAFRSRELLARGGDGSGIRYRQSRTSVGEQWEVGYCTETGAGAVEGWEEGRPSTASPQFSSLRRRGQRAPPTLFRLLHDGKIRHSRCEVSSRVAASAWAPITRRSRVVDRERDESCADSTAFVVPRRRVQDGQGRSRTQTERDGDARVAVTRTGQRRCCQVRAPALQASWEAALTRHLTA